MTAEDYYRQGNEHRRHGLWHEAINSYAKAAELDPDGPAATAKAMLEDIMNYYHKDAYNP